MQSDAQNVSNTSESDADLPDDSDSGSESGSDYVPSNQSEESEELSFSPMYGDDDDSLGEDYEEVKMKLFISNFINVLYYVFEIEY